MLPLAMLAGLQVVVSALGSRVPATRTAITARPSAVVLETDGTLSVVPKRSLGDGSVLRDVPGVEP